MDSLEITSADQSAAYLRDNHSPVVLLNDGLLNLPLDALQIKGRFTPISAHSNVSTRESSLNSSAHNSRRSSYFVPDELEYDNVEVLKSASDNHLAVDDSTPAGFNWSPLPNRKCHSERSEQDTMESEVTTIIFNLSN